MTSKFEVGLVIVGDEILSGKRMDQHFSSARKILFARGIPISWTVTIGDEKILCERFLRFSFSDDSTVVFCFGGIGSTPDDNTRQACACALDSSLSLNRDAEVLIRKNFSKMNKPSTPERLQMGEFPLGSELIPNPINGIPGFYIKNHYFLPGFPKMAHPMMEWVLDTKYKKHFSNFTEIDHFFHVDFLYESSITPALNKITKDYPFFKFYSLPQLRDPKNKKNFSLELGIKMHGNFKDSRVPKQSLFIDAVKELKNIIKSLGGSVIQEGEQRR